MERPYTSTDQLPVSLSASEVAQVLGISRAGAYNLLRSKGFPTIHIGKRMIVPKDKLLAWLDKQTEVRDVSA
jgi:excisionase family DNA binding protein